MRTQTDPRRSPPRGTLTLKSRPLALRKGYFAAATVAFLATSILALNVSAQSGSGLSGSRYVAKVASQLTSVTNGAAKPQKVNYSVVEKNAAKLDVVIGLIEKANVSGLSADESLAFYINAYNAHVLNAVLTKGLIKNGKSVGKGVLDVAGFFDKMQVEVAGEKMTLNRLEEKHIRSKGDPRIHFAVNCASVDCPPLTPVAYTGRKLQGQLETQSRAYLSRKGAVEFDDDNKTMRVAKLFEWYAKDFGAEAGVRRFIGRYVDDKRVATYKITYRPYNWKLNSTR